MPRRDLLVRNLCTAWKRCIKRNYSNRRINSERSLQAAFWSQLIKVLPESRAIFIEPVLSAGDCVLIPDILVCNSREVIGVVELKYTPRVKARIEKDICSLCSLARCSGDLRVANERYRGSIMKAKEYHFSKHVVFAWGGVHRETDPESRFRGLVENSGGIGPHSLLQMHAITESDAEPTVKCYRH